MPPKPKTKAEIQVEFRTTHPCPKCRMNLVDSATTLGHTPTVCAAYKATMEKKAAAKAKKAACKPAK